MAAYIAKKDQQLLTVLLPIVLYQRVKSTAKQTIHRSITQFVKTALLEKVEFYETKLRAEEEQRKADKKARTLKDRVDRTERGFGTSDLAPKPVLSSSVSETQNQEREVETYRFHAQRIFEALNNPLEKRVRITEAVSAIKQREPLLHPSDQAILTRLQSIIIAIRDGQKEENNILQPSLILNKGETPTELQRLEKRLQDQLIGTNIDTTKVASQGDTEDE